MTGGVEGENGSYDNEDEEKLYSVVVRPSEPDYLHPEDTLNYGGKYEKAESWWLQIWKVMSLPRVIVEELEVSSLETKTAIFWPTSCEVCKFLKRITGQNDLKEVATLRKRSLSGIQLQFSSAGNSLVFHVQVNQSFRASPKKLPAKKKTIDNFVDKNCRV